MSDIIDRISSYGIDLAQLQHTIKKRPGKPPGTLSAQSISLIVLGVVEEEWARREGSLGPSAEHQES